MREFKFRAAVMVFTNPGECCKEGIKEIWKFDKIIYDPWGFGCEGDDYDIFYLNKWLKSPQSDSHHRYKLMQYTGLKDSKGVEIYEGDVVRVFNDIDDSLFKGVVIVEWVELGFTFKIVKNEMKEPNTLDSMSMCHIGDKDTTEIIGNIYQNPEVLRKEKL